MPPKDHDDDQEKQEHKEELVSGFEVGLRVFFAKYGSYLLLAAALALLGYQAYNYFQKKHEVAVQQAWVDLQAAETSQTNAPALLAKVIADHDVKPVQAQAYLMLGNFYLQSVAMGMAPPGVEGARFDPDSELAEAEAAYRHALNGFPDDRLVQGAARMGLAAVAEDRANWDEAKKQYDVLIDPKGPFANSAFETQAGNRLARLDDLRHAPRLAAGAALNLPASRPGFPNLDTLGLPGGMNQNFTLPEAPAPAGPAVPQNLNLAPPGARATAPATQH